jgi:hypothetical protein
MATKVGFTVQRALPVARNSLGYRPRRSTETSILRAHRLDRRRSRSSPPTRRLRWRRKRRLSPRCRQPARRQSVRSSHQGSNHRSAGRGRGTKTAMPCRRASPSPVRRPTARFPSFPARFRPQDDGSAQTVAVLKTNKSSARRSCINRTQDFTALTPSPLTLRPKSAVGLIRSPSMCSNVTASGASELSLYTIGFRVGRTLAP